MTNIKLRHIVSNGHLHGMSAPGLNLDIALEPDALHRETQRRLTTGEQRQPLIIERGYTATGQIEQLSLQSPNSAGEQHYQYDALSRILFRSQQAQGQTRPTIAYNYDAAGRLVGSQHGHDAHRYPVDAAGNRSAAPNATNQLAQLNGTRYRYDGAGNLVNREHQNGERLTLGYDGANRLVTLTRTAANGQATHANYRYDALGRRIDKTVHHPNGTTATTHYGWDGDRIVREETTNQRSTVIYEPGSFVPMLRIDETQDPQGNQNTQLSAYITDALGTPLQLLTPKGQPRWLAEPDDWAAVTNQRAIRGLTQPIRFQGQWHDEESGLYYNRHRYYDPEQGRYISQDPIGLNGGTNLYGYVANPTGMVDPLGLETTVTIWKPVGRGNSSFGHVSTSINDTTYSYGPSGMSVIPTSEYISEHNYFRLGRGVHLDLTKEEEGSLQNCMSNNDSYSESTYSALTNNCGTPIQDCLKQLGYDLGSKKTLPVSLGLSLLDSELHSGSEFYHPTDPAEKSNVIWPFERSTAPWAK